MKLKDFFTQLKTQGKINDPEYDEWLKSAPDTEISDRAVKSIEDNFMTLERASAHPDIHRRITSEVLGPVDRDVNELLDFQLKEYLDPLTEQEIKGTNSSFKRLGLLKKIIPDVIKKIKTTTPTDEDTKKKLKEYQDTIQDQVSKFTKAEKDYNDKLKSYQDESEAKMEDYKLNSELEKLGNKYILAEAFEATRPAITEVIMSKIRSSNNLKLGAKDGRPVPLVYDETGKPRFNGNTPITIDNLLDEAYKPFLKKSETTLPSGTTRQTTQVTPPNNPSIRRGVSTTVQSKK